MRSLFTILLATALAIPAPRAQAQNTSDLTLKGRTVNDKGAVVDYATVSVSSVQDSTKTYGTVGDDKGAFEVRLPRGDYRLKISFMGYENLERQIELNSDTDLGDLTMHPSAVTLDEVVVTGNIITREADRFIVNLANTPLAIGRDGKEIMSLAPGVWISEKGEISVNGRKGTRVMVNDRMLRETGEDLLAYLQNLKAEDILKIEVIPYAGAEYDADMTSGIIKITLKKQRNDGMEGSATMRYGHSLVNDMVPAARRESQIPQQQTEPLHRLFTEPQQVRQHGLRNKSIPYRRPSHTNLRRETVQPGLLQNTPGRRGVRHRRSPKRRIGGQLHAFAFHRQ